MEIIGSSSNAHRNDSSGGSHDAGKENLTDEKDAFVNHAELAWKQMRTEWIGDRSKKLQRPPKGSTVSRTASYDDMILSREPFRRPIPLAEMVRFLVKIWQEEGFYELGDN